MLPLLPLLLLILVMTTTIPFSREVIVHRSVSAKRILPVGQRAAACQAQQSYEALKCTVVSMPNSPQAAVTGMLQHELMTWHDPWVSYNQP